MFTIQPQHLRSKHLHWGNKPQHEHHVQLLDLVELLYSQTSTGRSSQTKRLDALLKAYTSSQVEEIPNNSPT